MCKGVAKDEDFKGILEKCSNHAHGLFHIENCFLFKGTRLCILKYGFRELLIQELHGGALAVHFGVEKTYLMLKEHYYWLKMSKDAEHCVKRSSLAKLPRTSYDLKAFTHHFWFLKAF